MSRSRPASPILPEPARTEDLAPAARLAFGNLPAGEADRRVETFLRLVQAGEIDRRGVFVLRAPSGLAGVLLCAPVPGAGGLLWPPVCVAGPDRELHEDALIRHALAWLEGLGARVAQALLGPGEEPLGASLTRNGLPLVTHLWYLRHTLTDLTPSRGPGQARLSFSPFDPNDPAPFSAAHERTFEGTLDCPELSDVRTMQQVLEGHRAQGLFDPERWLLAHEGGKPVGVLLSVEVPESGEWEIVYMGLVPEARGRGLGRELLLRGLSQAREAGAPGVTLSVDARNLPAWGLYRAVGFGPTERAVHLLVWPCR